MTRDLTERETARLERRARVMKGANVVMRALLELPFETPLSSRLMLVRHTGRRTGRVYRQPVSYVRDAGSLLTPGGGNWTRNLRTGQPVVLRMEGRDVVARPELIRDETDVEAGLRVMLTRNRRLASFIPFVERDGTVDPVKLRTALRHGFCLVRWHLDDGGAS